MRDALEWIRYRGNPHKRRLSFPPNTPLLTIYLAELAGGHIIAIKPDVFHHVLEHLQINVCLCFEASTQMLYSATLNHWPRRERVVRNYPTVPGQHLELHAVWNAAPTWYEELAPLDIGRLMLPFVVELQFRD